MSSTLRRSELVDILKKVSPASRKSGLLPAWGRIYSDGKSTWCLNGDFWVRLPHPLPFVGGVEVDLLQSFLLHGTKEEISVEGGGDSVTIRSGRNRSQFVLHPISEDVVLNEPVSDNWGPGSELVSILNPLLPSLGRGSSQISHLGCTLFPVSGGMGTFVATDESTLVLSRVSCGNHWGSVNSLGLPPESVDHMMRICDSAFEFSPSPEGIRIRKEGYEFFSRVLPGMTKREIQLFVPVLKQRENFFQSTEEFGEALASIGKMTRSGTAVDVTEFQVKDEKHLLLVTKTEEVNIRNLVQVRWLKDPPEVGYRWRVKSSMIYRMLGRCPFVSVSDDLPILMQDLPESPSLRYLVCQQ